MDIFLKTAAGIIITIVLVLAVARQGKDIALLLTVAGCCMVAIVAIGYLQPIIDFLDKLRSIGNLNEDLIAILLKVVGVGILSEIVSLLCKDSGNESLGKALQVLSGAIMLWLSLPLLTKLLDLVESVLGSV